MTKYVRNSLKIPKYSNLEPHRILLKKACSHLSPWPSQELFAKTGSSWGYAAALLAAFFTAMALLCVRTLAVLGEPPHHAREVGGGFRRWFDRSTGALAFCTMRCCCVWCFLFLGGIYMLVSAVSFSMLYWRAEEKWRECRCEQDESQDEWTKLQCKNRFRRIQI